MDLIPHTQLEMSRFRSSRPVSIVPVSSSGAMDIIGRNLRLSISTLAVVANERYLPPKNVNDGLYFSFPLPANLYVIAVLALL